jgi:hypothetical protein
MKWMILLCLLVSCADDIAGGGYDTTIDQENEEDFPAPLPFTSYSTRLSNNLLISATACTGRETAVFEGRSFICQANQWLTVVDEINSCTPDGCTDVVVQPTITGLVEQGGDINNRFFQIRLNIPGSDRTQNILEDVLLRVDSLGNPTVIFN